MNWYTLSGHGLCRMLNHYKPFNQSTSNRGPLQPQVVLASTSRTYRTTVYTQHGKIVHVDQWSTDKDAYKLAQGYGNNKTTLTVKH